MSNARLFLAVAETAQGECRRLMDAGRRAKPDGSPGWIISFDPEQKSYRQACIAVVFAGTYFEAVTYLVAHLNGGRGLADQIGDIRRYARRAVELGLRADWIQQDYDRLQAARNDLVHEKCLDLNWKDDHPYLKTPSLQDEAEFAVGFVQRIDAILRGERPMEWDAKHDGERGPEPRDVTGR